MTGSLMSQLTHNWCFRQ